MYAKTGPTPFGTGPVSLHVSNTLSGKYAYASA